MLFNYYIRINDHATLGGPAHGTVTKIVHETLHASTYTFGVNVVNFPG